jgi:hypothetical protein
MLIANISIKTKKYLPSPPTPSPEERGQGVLAELEKVLTEQHFNKPDFFKRIRKIFFMAFYRTDNIFFYLTAEKT